MNYQKNKKVIIKKFKILLIKKMNIMKKPYKKNNNYMKLKI